LSAARKQEVDAARKRLKTERLRALRAAGECAPPARKRDEHHGLGPKDHATVQARIAVVRAAKLEHMRATGQMRLPVSVLDAIKLWETTQ
jgi:hypothetical protein